MSIKQLRQRRLLLQGLSLGGVGAVLATYQNCSRVGFNAPGASGGDSNQSSTGYPDNCARPLSIFDAPSQPVLTMPSSATSVSASSTGNAAVFYPKATFYQAVYYPDPTSSAKSTISLLTVDAAAKSATNTFVDLAMLTDVSVYGADGNLLYWRRIGSEDLGSTTIVLDDAVVSSKQQLRVVTNSLQLGAFSQIVDLSQPAMNYASAVGTWNGNLPFGGSTLLRPYIAASSTGNQGDLGLGHTPDFWSVTDSVVQVTLGPVNAKHGRAGATHYMAVAYLFDQAGNLLTNPAEESYDMATDHNFVFSNLNLKSRGVTSLRVVIGDTLNGFVQGFVKV